MAKTKIEWCDRTWNPVTGCSPISEGCENCYARRMAQRLKGRFGYPEDDPFRVTFHYNRIEEPLRWRKPQKIFTVSMGDLFHPDLPACLIRRVFDTIERCPQHTFMILTKRPERMEDQLCHNVMFMDQPEPNQFVPHVWPNVWLGVTAENQKRLDERASILLRIPAKVRFVSLEPMLGPIELDPWLKICKHWKGEDSLKEAPWHPPYPKHWYKRQALVHADWKLPIHWVIVGGETGPRARPMHPDWVRSVRDQCQEAGVPFFFKGWGEWVPTWVQHSKVNQFLFPRPYERQGYWHRSRAKVKPRLLDGRTWEEWPE